MPAEVNAVDYPLISFPWQPWMLTNPTRELPEAEAASYADWLNAIEAERLQVITGVLAEAGAPAAGPGESAERLGELGSWIQRWFSVLAEPLVLQGFIRDVPRFRLGQAWVDLRPHLRHYSRDGDVLLHTLAHDLAFLVIGCARTGRPELTWRLAFDQDYQRSYVVLGPDAPGLELIRQICDFLVQALARPRGGRGADLRRWYGGTLLRAYEQAATGIVPAPVDVAFPDVDGGRKEPRYHLSRAARSDPQPASELLAAVGALRQAGWFGSSRLSVPDLAGAARAAWLAYEHTDLPLAAPDLYCRLLVLDAGRTWSEDVDANVVPGDGIHAQTLTALGGIGAPGLRIFVDPAEDWSSRPGDVLLDFVWRRCPRQLLLPDPGRYLSPALITGLNELLPATRQRLWFADQGPPLAIVTRATTEERDRLEQLTSIRLTSDPPAWWSALAPLPRHQRT